MGGRQAQRCSSGCAYLRKRHVCDAQPLRKDVAAEALLVGRVGRPHLQRAPAGTLILLLARQLLIQLLDRPAIPAIIKKPWCAQSSQALRI